MRISASRGAHATDAVRIRRIRHHVATHATYSRLTPVVLPRARVPPSPPASSLPDSGPPTPLRPPTRAVCAAGARGRALTMGIPFPLLPLLPLFPLFLLSVSVARSLAACTTGLPSHHPPLVNLSSPSNAISCAAVILDKLWLLSPAQCNLSTSTTVARLPTSPPSSITAIFNAEPLPVVLLRLSTPLPTDLFLRINLNATLPAAPALARLHSLRTPALAVPLEQCTAEPPHESALCADTDAAACAPRPPPCAVPRRDLGAALLQYSRAGAPVLVALLAARQPCSERRPAYLRASALAAFLRAQRDTNGARFTEASGAYAPEQVRPSVSATPSPSASPSTSPSATPSAVAAGAAGPADGSGGGGDAAEDGGGSPLEGLGASMPDGDSQKGGESRWVAVVVAGGFVGGIVVTAVWYCLFGGEDAGLWGGEDG